MHRNLCYKILLYAILTFILASCISREERANRAFNDLIDNANTHSVAFGSISIEPKQDANCSLLIDQSDRQPFTVTRVKWRYDLPGYTMASMPPGAYKMVLLCTAVGYSPGQLSLPLQLNIPAAGKAYYFGHIIITLRPTNDTSTVTGFLKDMTDGKPPTYAQVKIYDNYEKAAQDYQQHYGRANLSIEKNFPENLTQQ